MTNRSRIEVRLAKLREELVILSMNDDRMSDNEAHLLHIIDQAIPSLRQLLREVYADGTIYEKEARLYYNLLKETLDNALAIAKLDEVVHRDESDLLNHVHNTFVQLTRWIKEDIQN